MTRPDDELDNLLRSHLSGELDAHRGGALRAFEQQVTRPMQRQLKRRDLRTHLAQYRHQYRHWGAIGLSMAACMAIGAVLPRFLSPSPAVPAHTGEIATAGTNGTVVAPQFADFERTTVLRHVDAGAVRLENGEPGRKILQQKFETLRFTDPSTNERMEYVIPSQQDLFYSVNRQ